MPELPEVQQFTDFWKAATENRKVQQIVAYDDLVVPDEEAIFNERFVGKVFSQHKRIGKYLLTGTDSGEWMYFHFGMTGDFAVIQTGDEPPRFTRFAVHLSDGTAVAFLCARKLGRAMLIETPDAFIAKKGLGPDAMAVTWEEFQEIFGNARGKIKPALMDQGKIAGIGNIYADEMLYQAGIHPEAVLEKIGPKRLKRLFEAMRRSLEKSITYDTPKSEIPSDFLIHNRKKKGICQQCERPLAFIKMGGRGTYFCSRCQRK